MKIGELASWILLNCLTVKGGFNNRCQLISWWKNKNFTHQLNHIISYTPEIQYDNISHRCYHIINPNYESKCRICENKTKFISYKEGYSTICSRKCSFKDPVRNKRISENLDTQKLQEKVKENNLKKYGVECTWQLESVKEKTRKTKLERYGDSNYNNSRRLIKNVNSAYVAIEHFEKKRSYTEIAQELGMAQCTLSTKMMAEGYEGVRFRQQSSYEREIKDWLSDYTEVKISDRRTIRKTELDLYLPQHKIAIEMNGIYWHNDTIRPQYHLIEKQKLCLEHGIRIINIWDVDWLNKTDIMKSIILNNINVSSSKIYARNCGITQISSLDYRNFCRDNHALGPINSMLKYGLVYNDELVAVMGIGKNRFKKNSWELHRYCNQLNSNVVGGASRLFKNMIHENKITDIISYCDNRFFTGKLYEKLGFEYFGTSKPNYWYFKKNFLESRVKYQKHKLPKLLPNFDINMTEYENMINNGYLRVFDCGNKIYQYKKEQ